MVVVAHGPAQAAHYITPLDDCIGGMPTRGPQFLHRYFRKTMTTTSFMYSIILEGSEGNDVKIADLDRLLGAQGLVEAVCLDALPVGGGRGHGRVRGAHREAGVRGPVVLPQQPHCSVSMVTWTVS